MEIFTKKILKIKKLFAKTKIYKKLMEILKIFNYLTLLFQNWLKIEIKPGEC